MVEVQTVEAMDVDQEYVYTATTEADKVNNISSSMPLRIKSILVEEGQNVSAGQRVAVLDDVNAASYEPAGVYGRGKSEKCAGRL